MNLKALVEIARDKTRFPTISDYADFCLAYLEFIKTSLQAVIVSRNETNYRFFQYKEDGNFTVTRPINSNLMIPLEEFSAARDLFLGIIGDIRGPRDATDMKGAPFATSSIRASRRLELP